MVRLLIITLFVGSLLNLGVLSAFLNINGEKCEWRYECCQKNDEDECVELCHEPAAIVCVDIAGLPMKTNILNVYKCPEGYLKDENNICRRIAF